MKNKILVISGLLLAVVAFAGVFFLNKIQNPEAIEVVMATRELTEGTSLNTLAQADFRKTSISGNGAMKGVFVTWDELLSMLNDGKLINTVAQGELVRYTDIMSANNRYSSRQLSLGQTDPNLVTMTIDVTGFAPIGIHNGDYIDIIASVNGYNSGEAYENDLANLILEAKQKAVEGSTMTQSKADQTVSSFGVASDNGFSMFDFGSQNSSSNLFSDPTSTTTMGDTNVFNVTSQNSMTQELMEAADDLSAKTDELRAMLDEWNAFLELYGSVDITTLTSMFDEGFYLAPLSKVLVQGAKVVNVNRAETSNYDGTASNRLGEVTSLDVLVPRDAIEWVAMANTAGSLRVAVLSANANPEGSGPTLGASLQDFIEAFVDDRNDLKDNEAVVIPSSR